MSMFWFVSILYYCCCPS